MDKSKMTLDVEANKARMRGPSLFPAESIARRKLDVQYGTLPEQKIDVYYPAEGDGPWPLIMYIHGGGWYLGNKRECSLESIIDALNCGYAVASVDYRLVPAGKFPEFMYDAKTAVRWARANAKEYSFDPDHIAVMGDSAGAQISLSLGFTEGRPEWEGEKYGWAGISSAVQAVIDVYGPTMLDVKNADLLAETGVPIVRFFDGSGDNTAPLDGMMTAFTDDKDLLAFISPIAFVHKDIPPVLILQGESDPIVPVQHSLRLAERITEICGKDRVELHLYPERTHADFAFMNDETAHTAVQFLDKYMK